MFSILEKNSETKISYNEQYGWTLTFTEILNLSMY